MEMEKGKLEIKDLIPLSQINTFVYCPRRFYYEFVEGEMRVNEHVEEGKIKHQRVDQPMQDRSEREKLVSRRQYLASEKLGVSGFSDVIEEQDGILFPVEYKKGKTGNWLNDKVQLCLEGMLLEEATGKSVPHGYIYYIGSNRRRKIEFDDELRNISLEAVKNAYQVSKSDRIPNGVWDNRCNGCSVRAICLPDEIAYLKGLDERPTRIQTSLGIDNVLYVDEQGSALKKEGERILVLKEGEVIRDMPVINVGQVVICGAVSLTTPLMNFLMKSAIPVIFLSMYGRYQGALTPEVSRNSFLRIAQYKALDDETKVLNLSKCFVTGKLSNMRAMLKRREREYKNPMVGDAALSISHMLDKVERVESKRIPLMGLKLDELLGIEGNASAEYFRVFDLMLKDEMGFDFEKRTRRPPTDPVNAMLSFAYSLLAADMTSAIQIVGLDPYIGYYHQLHYGRPCLSLDLMEEFRSIVADSVVISMINHREVKPEDFTESNGGYFLSDQARKKFYAAYERRKEETITHPVFKYKLSYRRSFELQARILAKFLMGEIDQYYPLIVR